MEEWGAPERGETEDVSSNVAETIANFANALMPKLDSRGCLAVMTANPDWLDAEMKMPGETLKDTVRGLARSLLCEGCLQALSSDIEAFVATHWPAAQPTKGMAP